MAGNQLRFQGTRFGKLEACLAPMSTLTALALALVESFGERWEVFQELRGVWTNTRAIRDGRTECLSLPYLGPRAYITSVGRLISYPKDTDSIQRRHG